MRSALLTKRGQLRFVHQPEVLVQIVEKTLAEILSSIKANPIGDVGGAVGKVGSSKYDGGGC
jgi:tRNA1(Val) A37 N6-methylase TrmN6